MADALTDLDAAVAGVHAQVHDLTAQAAALTQQNAGLVAANGDLTAKNAALQQELDDCRAQLPKPPAHEVLLGFYLTGNAGSAALDAMAGVKAPLFRWYGSLANPGLKDPIAREADGRVGIISAASHDYSTPQKPYLWTDIVKGAYNPQIDAWGKSLALLKSRHYVGFCHEPDTQLAVWQRAGITSESPSAFAAAHDYVVARWKAAGADHMWTPCYQASLHGDPKWLPKVRDRVGFDPYNWFGTSHTGSPWAWPETLLDGAIAAMEAAGDATTPLLICETGANEDGRKPEWLTRLYQAAVDRPRFEAVSYFSVDQRGAVEKSWWSVDSSAASLAAWRAAMKVSVS